MSGFSQKSVQQLGVDLGPLDTGQVPGLADQLEPGAGDQVDGFAHQIGRGRAIFRARNSQRRQSEPAGWRLEIRAGDGGTAAQIPLHRLAYHHIAP